MKILLLTENQDTFFHLLLQSLNNLDVNIGHASFPVNQQEIEQFNPDIIIHNSQTTDRVNYGNAINIGINELGAPNCFSFRNKESTNFIKPFVVDDDGDFEDQKYKCDAVYVGNPSLLPDCVNEIENEAVFKIVHNMPVPISNYCGSCTFNDYKKFFKMSKCSILSKSDSDTDIYSFKLLDVLYADGNPVLHNGSDEQFISDIKDAINGKSFRENFITKEEIKKKHTNKNRMSEIFTKIGLNKLAKMVLEGKGK
jgi:hypothetical protein